MQEENSPAPIEETLQLLGKIAGVNIPPEEYQQHVEEKSVTEEAAEK